MQKNNDGETEERQEPIGNGPADADILKKQQAQGNNNKSSPLSVLESVLQSILESVLGSILESKPCGKGFHSARSCRGITEGPFADLVLTLCKGGGDDARRCSEGSDVEVWQCIAALPMGFS